MTLEHNSCPSTLFVNFDGNHGTMLQVDSNEKSAVSEKNLTLIKHRIYFV